MSEYIQQFQVTGKETFQRLSLFKETKNKLKYFSFIWDESPSMTQDKKGHIIRKSCETKGKSVILQQILLTATAQRAGIAEELQPNPDWC